MRARLSLRGALVLDDQPLVAPGIVLRPRTAAFEHEAIARGRRVAG